MKTLDPVLHQNRKAGILAKARHLFATKGYSETSVDDIAQACDMQKASLYHYFESKQRLLQELVDVECARWERRMSTLATAGTLEQTLSMIAKAFLKNIDDPGHREFFKLIHFESHKNPAISEALKESPTHNKKGFYALFENHLKSRLTPSRVGIFVTQFMGALIHWATMTRLRNENTCLARCTDAEYVEQLVGTFTRGIA